MLNLKQNGKDIDVIAVLDAATFVKEAVVGLRKELRKTLLINGSIKEENRAYNML